MASYANPKYRPGAGVGAAPEPESPVEEAAQDAIKQRLEEQQRAETLQQQPRQDPALATEPQREQQRLPPAVQEWLTEHPDYLRDPERNLELQLAHHRAVKSGVDIHSAGYVPEIERRLGLSEPPPAVPSAPRHSDSYSGMGFSAPPSREPPSMGGGRRLSEGSRLTIDEAAMARSLGLTQEQYRTQKEKMLRLKASGALQA